MLSGRANSKDDRLSGWVEAAAATTLLLAAYKAALRLRIEAFFWHGHASFELIVIEVFGLYYFSLLM